MELYDLNVAKVMDFMKESGYGASSKSLHKLCYKAFRDYLVETHLTYSQEVAAKWLESNKDIWIYRNYTGYRHCLEQLGDIYESGNVLPDHMGPQKPNYSLLCKRLRCEVDEYLDYALSQGISSSDIPRRRIACARFMVYLQCKGLTSIAQINYSLLLSFHEDDYHKSFKSKDVYEDLIRAMLRYFVSIGKCKIGHSLVLSKLLIHQVIKDSSFISGVTDSRTINGKNDDLWNGIGKFLACLREERYGITVIKSSKHTLTLLYIFLDMHGISLLFVLT
ncbi:MAG: hypothetical protein PHD56_02255 [Anaerostipes sp.]|nr:hypothetical protein [Anaerostipes sp.]